VFKEDGTLLQFEERPAIRALHEGRVVENFVVGIRSAESGILRWVRLHARPIIFPGEERPSLAVSSLTDITEQRRLESLLAHTQKMEAVGRLAGGVAHDFNNLLTALRGYTDLLLLESPPDSPQHAYAEHIARAGERASALTRQLLTLSRRQILKLEVFDLHDLLSDLNGMLQGLLGANVTLQLGLEATRTHLNMDRGQLEQVVLNLVINSRDAMPRGGSLWIETCDASLTGRESNLVCVGQPGEHVELRVRDTGAGMDRETLQHIFEPFYTTKPQGQGTGLGLASVYGVVQQFAGSLAVSSTPGSGTEFRIYLPLTGETPGTRPASPGLRAHRGGSESVLLVEDEPMVRSLITSVLTSNGYRVIAAADGAEALHVADSHPGGFDLLLSDIVMPGLNGLDLSALLHARWPRMAVLHMTGYADADAAGAEGLRSGPSLLQKPFTPKELLARVRDRLDAAPAAR
jgi:signal transduction histidine kinase/ActR/RegA family two-component response regulator